jgi:PAS domain S-box-containing protein
MRLHYKIMGVLLLAFLIPVIVLGSGGYLSIKRTGDRAAEHSVEALLAAEQDRLQDDTRARALDVEQLCGQFEAEVVHIAARLERTHLKLDLYRLDTVSDTYSRADFAGLPHYGYVHPKFGAYADFDEKGPGSPWVPRPVIDRVRKNPATRAVVTNSLHTVMLLNNELIDAHERFPETVDVAWTALVAGVSNSQPPYHFKEVIARNPGILDMDESQQDYVKLAAPESNPERKVRWVEPYLDQFKGVWMTSCVAPAYDDDTFLGAVGIDILLTAVTKRVLYSSKRQHSYAFLIGRAGTLVAIPEAAVDELLWDETHRKAVRETFLPPSEQRWSDAMARSISDTKLDASPNPELRAVIKEMRQGRSGLRTFELGGAAKLVSYAPVRETGWSLAVVVPVEDVVGPSREVQTVLATGVSRTLRDYVVLGILGALVSIVVAGMLHQRVIRPLGRFTASVADIRWDNLAFALPTSSGRGELGRLYAKFSDMLKLIRDARDELTVQRAALEDANEKLVAANEQLERENDVRRTAEQALAKEKELLSVTLRSIGDGVIAADVAGRVLLLNPVAGELTGWSPDEAVGVPLSEVFHVVHEQTRARVSDPISRLPDTATVVGSAQSLLIARDGTERQIADSAAPIRDADGELKGVVVVFRDITEHKRMEDALITAQKLETVRLLAAGIAHDFNNLLTSIVGNLSLVRRLASRQEPFEERLTDTEQALRRARDLTKQLLTFSSGGAPVRKPLDLAPILQEASRFALRGSNVRFEYDGPTDLWSVVADEGQIAQVLQNLVINAAQAIPEGGTIRVRAANRIIEPGRALSVAPGRFVEVEVADEGKGIAENDLRRVFEPFFSTKPQGSGLGLAVCFSIVHRHEGTITVDSRLGEGTTVRFLLPASESFADVDEAPPPSRSGSGRVLIMDDDATIRLTSSAMLRELGYDVVCTADGDEAVSAYRQAAEAGRPFDLVVLDLTVPGRPGGLEAMAELKAINPDVRAIVASGYSTAPVMDHVHDYGFCASIAKPFGIDELGKVIGDALRKKREPES